MTPLHLTLLRHGRSRADDEGVHEGRYDSPLTEVGRAQARALAAYWRAYPPGFGRVVCSDLVRASETADIVGAALGLTPEPSPLWRENVAPGSGAAPRLSCCFRRVSTCVGGTTARWPGWTGRRP